MARHEKLAAFIRLANELGDSTRGLTVEEIQSARGASRRTVERSLDALRGIFDLQENWDEDRRKRWRIGGGLDTRALTAPTSGELVELRHAVATLRRTGQPGRADTLQALAAKLGQAMKARDRTRIGTDIEALMEAETIARRPAPRKAVDADILSALRHALLAMTRIEILYARPGQEATRQTLVPYGLLFGTQSYLVAVKPPYTAPYQYRLDRIRSVAMLDEPGAVPEDFDLAAYADRSFGTFQEEPETVVLRFSPEAADDAEGFQFHASQVSAREADGSLTVRFTCGGLLQVAHHLFTWGDTVRIVAPKRLRDIMREAIDRARAATAEA